MNHKVEGLPLCSGVPERHSTTSKARLWQLLSSASSSHRGFAGVEMAGFDSPAVRKYRPTVSQLIPSSRAIRRYDYPRSAKLHMVVCRLTFRRFEALVGWDRQGVSNHLGKADPNSIRAIGTDENEIWSNGGWSVTLQGHSGSPIHLQGYWSAVQVREDGAWKDRMQTWNITPAPAATK